MGRMARKTFIVFIFLLVLALSLLKALLPSSDEATASAEEERGVVTALKTVERQTLAQDLTFTGTLESDSTAMISPKIAGSVVLINVHEGQAVKKGDILISLDQTQLQATKDTVLKKKATLNSQASYLEKEIADFSATNPITDKIAAAEDALSFQKDELEKSLVLYEAGAISQSAFDQAQNQVKALQHQRDELINTADASLNKLVQEKTTALHQLKELDSSLAEMDVSLSEMKIRAPFDGHIRQIMVSEGDLAIGGKPVVILDKSGLLKVSAQVSETDLSRLSEGMEAEITLPGSDKVYHSKISFVSTSVDPKSRMGMIEAALDEVVPVAIIGSSAKVRFILTREENQLIIPAEAVKDLKDRHVVYVCGDDLRVSERVVTVGIKVGNLYQILEGLEEGEKIAVNNLDSLYDGTSIYAFDKEAD